MKCSKLKEKTRTYFRIVQFSAFKACANEHVQLTLGKLKIPIPQYGGARVFPPLNLSIEKSIQSVFGVVESGSNGN